MASESKGGGSTEAGFVVEKGVGEVEVAVELPVVELDGYGVVGVLVNGPGEAD